MKNPARLILGGGSLLFLLLLGLVCWNTNIPWVGKWIIFVGLGGIPVFILLASIYSPSQRVPSYQQLGLPEPSEFPEGLIVVRFWRGLLGNTPAAVVVDPKQPEILFINCLGYPNFFDTALPIARVSNDQILDVWDYPSDVRGIDGRRLEIKTRMGNAKIMMMRDSKQVWPENYEMLRDHLAQEFPGDTSARKPADQRHVTSNLAPNGKTTLPQYIVSPWKLAAIFLPITILLCTSIVYFFFNGNDVGKILMGVFIGAILGLKMLAVALFYNRQ
jgi:hypothetical protein